MGLFLPPHALLTGTAALAEPPYAFANAEAATLVGAMTVAPGTARKSLIDTFIGSLKTAGVWAKLDVMWVLAAHDEQAARLNWVSPGSFTCAVVNIVTFTPDRGYAGDGVSGNLDTGWAPNTHAVRFTQNNAHLSAYQRTGGANGNEGVSINNGSFNASVHGGTGTSTRGKLNSGTQINGAAGGGQPLHGLVRRNDGSNVSVIRDGLQVTAPSSATSSAIGSGNLRVGARGNSTYVNAQYSLVSAGAYLDDTECASFYAAASAFMVAVGADT